MLQLWGFECTVWSLGWRGCDLMVKDSCVWVDGRGFLVQDLWFGGSGAGFLVQD